MAFALALLLALGCCGTAIAADGGLVDFLPEAKPAPEDDLYGAVNFDTVKAAEMPAAYSIWSAAVVNDLEISEELNEMLDEYVANAGTWEKGTPEQKIADLLPFLCGRRQPCVQPGRHRRHHRPRADPRL